MGFGCEQVDRWEPYQVAAVMRGYMAANSPPIVRAPTDEQFRQAVGRLMH